MPHIGIPELIVFGVVVLLLFGSRLPSIMRSLGQTITSFKKGTREAEMELEQETTRKA